MLDAQISFEMTRAKCLRVEVGNSAEGFHQSAAEYNDSYSIA